MVEVQLGSVDPDKIADADKLMALARWFDIYDDKRGFTGVRGVQADLRRMARALVWQPIETVPDDVSEILATFSKKPSERLVLFRVEILGLARWADVNGMYYAPTHWRPAPNKLDL